MWFDSHCHLHLCEDNAPLTQVVERARTAGVDEMVAIAIDRTSSWRAAEIATEHQVYGSAGVHPNSAHDWDDDTAAEVEGLLAAPRIVAVGETGLDFYRDYCPRAVQERAFSRQIELARAHNLALVIHTRDSVGAALDMLESRGAPERLVFHCWSGDADDLRRALALGAFVSFAGNVSFRNAENLREAARLVPPDRLLIETDAPFLAPVPHRGTPNEPAFVVDVGNALAAVRKVESGELARTTSANARAVFRLG